MRSGTSIIPSAWIGGAVDRFVDKLPALEHLTMGPLARLTGHRAQLTIPAKDWREEVATDPWSRVALFAARGPGLWVAPFILDGNIIAPELSNMDSGPVFAVYERPGQNDRRQEYIGGDLCQSAPLGDSLVSVRHPLSFAAEGVGLYIITKGKTGWLSGLWKRINEHPASPTGRVPVVVWVADVWNWLVALDREVSEEVGTWLAVSPLENRLEWRGPSGLRVELKPVGSPGCFGWDLVETPGVKDLIPDPLHRMAIAGWLGLASTLDERLRDPNRILPIDFSRAVLVHPVFGGAEVPDSFAWAEVPLVPDP